MTLRACREDPRRPGWATGVTLLRVDSRHPASQRVSKWGLVHGWLVMNPSRRVEMKAGSAGFVMTVEDPFQGAYAVPVGVDEDPSSAAWRAIARLTASSRR